MTIIDAKQITKLSLGKTVTFAECIQFFAKPLHDDFQFAKNKLLCYNRETRLKVLFLLRTLHMMWCAKRVYVIHPISVDRNVNGIALDRLRTTRLHDCGRLNIERR